MPCPISSPLPPKFPLVISPKTYECLTSVEPRPMPGAKPPTVYQFALQKSECGRYLSFYEPERFSLQVILPTPEFPEGVVITSFYGDGWSNFRAKTGGAKWTVNGRPIDFKCAEQVFKAVSVVAQMDPSDDSSPKAQLLSQVLETVMTGSKPKDCKLAVFKIPADMFDSETWDDQQAPYVMETAQYWKCLAPDFHGMMKQTAQIARTYGVQRLYFVEAAGSDDLRWGCGLTVDEMHANVAKNLDSAVRQCMVREGSPLPFVGKNLLGEALTRASRGVLGDNFEYLDETLEDFTARIGIECPFFVYAPPSQESDQLSRPGFDATGVFKVPVARTGSADAPDNTSEAPIGRTGSADAPDNTNSETADAPDNTSEAPIGRTGSSSGVIPMEEEEAAAAAKSPKRVRGDDDDEDGAEACNVSRRLLSDM